jgi:hypothetical protein
MNRTAGLRANSMRWLPYVFTALLALPAADAALVFQDRHTDSGGAQIVYSFETNSQETASPVDQTQATKVATTWAAKYYKLPAPSVVSVRTRKHADPFLVDSIMGADRGQTRNLLCRGTAERFDR